MKKNEIMFRGKKSFSLMEVIIATSLLSIVMLSLFQIKSNNIFILDRATTEKKNKEYLMMAMDTQEYKKRNENIYMDRLFSIQDDDLRREFKEIKIKVKDEILETQEYKGDDFSLKISEYKTSYSFENGIKKDIYRFKLEL
ncbi:type II secretion system protein J [Arcobacter sp. LA11]|uniref:PulJ/GspJ family protein n=1 Tax=Arcobacter sp. LA11 TaxID=1898176 RepID=UPI0009329390|nr:type II secretion system protein [Arcobacter sp. LA11]